MGMPRAALRMCSGNMAEETYGLALVHAEDAWRHALGVRTCMTLVGMQGGGHVRNERACTVLIARAGLHQGRWERRCCPRTVPAAHLPHHRSENLASQRRALPCQHLGVGPVGDCIVMSQRALPHPCCAHPPVDVQEPHILAIVGHRGAASPQWRLALVTWQAWPATSTTCPNQPRVRAWRQPPVAIRGAPASSRTGGPPVQDSPHRQGLTQPHGRVLPGQRCYMPLHPERACRGLLPTARRCFSGPAPHLLRCHPIS